MKISNATIVTAADGTVATKVESKSLMEAAIGVATMPFKLADNDTNYVSENLAAVGTLVWGIGGFLGGDLFGNKRAQRGRGPILSFLA